MSHGVNQHPAITEAREVIELEQQVREQPVDLEMAALARAVMLALTLDTCIALLRGETVPLSKLDPAYFRRYGVRRAA